VLVGRLINSFVQVPIYPQVPVTVHSNYKDP